MSKFKVEDRVIGNEKASIRYAITQKGWEGRVTKVCGEDIFVYGPGSISDIGFMVSSECFDLDSQALAPSIHITTDGKTATATIEQNNTEYKVSTEFACYKSVKAATQAALDKAWNLANGKYTVRSVREVKRPAKVGEYIKIVDPKYNATYTINDYVKGDIKCVLKTWGSGASFESNSKTASGNAHVWHEEYVVLEGYTPEPEKPKYYNGKVVCVEVFDDAPDLLVAGKVYTVDDGRFVWCGGTRSKRRYTDFQDLVERFGFAKFIEFKGEA